MVSQVTVALVASQVTQVVPEIPETGVRQVLLVMVVQRVTLVQAAQALQRHQTLQPLGLPLSLQRRQVQPLLAPVVLEVPFVADPEVVRFLVRGVYQTLPQQVRPCSLPDTAVAAAVGPLTAIRVVLAIPVVLGVQVPQVPLVRQVLVGILERQETPAVRDRLALRDWQEVQVQLQPFSP